MMDRMLIHSGGILEYDASFLSTGEADELFKYLQENVSWEQKMYTNRKTGQQFPQPRLTAWYADNTNMDYSYSGVTQVVQPWLPKLLELKNKIEAVSGAKYNSVLLNLYRDGKDSVGLHADNEKELGTNANIASVSLGSIRSFCLSQYRQDAKWQPPAEGYHEGGYQEFRLNHGSLLVMSGTTQHYWKHEVPKENSSEPRINLTYRYFTA